MSNSDELDESNCYETTSYCAPWKSMVAGAGAGTISTILCAPLDVVKVRMQIQGSLGITKYSGNIFSTLKNIHIEEGVGGLFKGVGPALFTVPVFWSVYWPIYDKMKTHIERTYPNTNTHVTHLISAVVAGGTGDIITNPFWVTRTRIQALILHKHIPVSAHVNMIGMMRRIYHEEGFRAFYKGLGASFLGLSHVAIQFPLYEYLKKIARERSGNKPENFWEITAASVTAKMVASCVTYPHEVIRARLQDTRHTPKTIGITTVTDVVGGMQQEPVTPHTLRSVFLNIVRREGVLSLWTGVHINFIRIIPATSAFFLSYEYISRWLNSSNPHAGVAR